MEKYKYEIKSTGYSSQRYGPCEICKKDVSEVFLQREFRVYKLSERSKEAIESLIGKPAGEYGEMLTGGGGTFGHEECLVGIRKIEEL